uniref:Nucleolar complex protein 2 homolog n=1 Tax=Romanomermis culicivorax TaxID=13658 RepID=A0A915IAD6_ROMCU
EEIRSRKNLNSRSIRFIFESYKPFSRSVSPPCLDKIGSKMPPAKKKSALSKIREKDPEFFKFLKEQNANIDAMGGESEGDDDVLSSPENDDEGNLSCDSSLVDEINAKIGDLMGEADRDEEDEPETDNERIVVEEGEESKRLSSKKKRYKKNLEEVIDEMSSGEESANEDLPESKPVLSGKEIKLWEKELQADNITIELINNLCVLFKAAAEKAGAKIDDGVYSLNSVKDYEKAVELCYLNFPRVWRKPDERKPSVTLERKKLHKPSMRFKSATLRPIIKNYLNDVLKYLPEIQDKDILKATLIHINESSDFVTMFPRKSRLFLKALIGIWCDVEKQCMQEAFACIKSILVRLKKELFIFAFKCVANMHRMYLSYGNLSILKVSDVQHAQKSDSMHDSFADVCGIDTTTAYQHAFVSIRDLAISLRGAITSKKEDDIKSLHSKKFINLLYLWSTVLSKYRDDENLGQLIYPLAQVAIGCFKHVNQITYLPIRIHCLKCLLILTKNSKIYIPLFGFLGEIINTIIAEKSTKKQQKTLTSKILTGADLDRVLKISRSQLEDESCYKAAVLEKVVDLLVEYLERICCSLAFRELTFLPTINLKRCVKDLHVKYRNVNKITQIAASLKELSRKIDDHSSWLEVERAKSSLNFEDEKSLQDFEDRIIADDKNSMIKYCKSYGKLVERLRRRIHFSDKIVDQKTKKSAKRPGNRSMSPIKSKKMKKSEKANKKKRKEVVESYDSDESE